MARSVWKGPFVDLHLLKKAIVTLKEGDSIDITEGARG